MKRIVFLALLFLSIQASAQIDKNTMMAGGSVMFNKYTPKGGGASFTAFMVNPNFGYFVADNFVVGAGVGFNAYGSGNNIVYFSPYLRYFVKKFYLQTKFDYGRSNSQNNSNLSFDLGYALFLNDNVALEPAFYFSQNLNGQGSNLGFKMGFQIYFNR
jgi:hypothetical protein